MASYNNRTIGGWTGSNDTGDRITATCIECGFVRAVSLTIFKSKRIKKCCCTQLSLEQLQRAVGNRYLKKELK